MTPLASYGLGGCHVMLIEVNVTLCTVILMGGPDGAISI